MPLGCPLLDVLPHRQLPDRPEGQIVELEITDDIRGPGGAVHGGLVCSLADCAGASAVARASGRLVATTSVNISLLAAGRVGPLRAIGTPLRITQQQGTAEVKIYDAGKDNRLIASALLTCSFLPGEEFERRTR